MRVTEANKQSQVSWLCVAQRIVMPEGMAPLHNEAEWVGQTIDWTLLPEGTGTLLTFFHEGLTAVAECWAVCEPGWSQTLQSFALLLETGRGMPFEKLDSDHLARAQRLAGQA